MEVKEVVRLKDGRDVTVNLSETEAAYVFSVGFNYLLAEGAVALGAIGGDEMIGTEEAKEIVQQAHKESKKATKQ
jgi:hypothetical protein